MRRRHLESVSVRSTDDAFASFVSSTASDRKGFVKGEAVPLDRILVPFVRTKGTPPRRAVLTMPLQKAPRRRRRDKIITFCQQPLSQPAADSLSLRLGHGAALICHRHIIHYRAATSLPLTQGNLWGGVTAGWLLEYHITVITLSKNDMSKKRFFCVTNN